MLPTKCYAVKFVKCSFRNESLRNGFGYVNSTLWSGNGHGVLYIKVCVH